MELLRRFKFIMALMILTTLVACGGGDGGLTRDEGGGDDVPEVGDNALTITSFVDNTSISDDNPAKIIVHFEDADGNALIEEVITLTSTLGELNPETGTVLTNNTGDATIELKAGTEEGAGILTATSSTGDVVDQGFYTEGDGGGDVLSISSFTNRTSISYVDDITATITVHFENSENEPKPNEVITLTSPLGVLDPATGAVITDDAGNATIELTAGTEEGAGVLTATSDTGDTDTQGFYTKGDALPVGGNVLTISSFTNSSLISKYNSSIITVHFDDENGTALSDKVITLTATIGVLDPATGAVTTDDAGNATIELTAGTIEGAGVLTATSGTGDVVTQGFYTRGNFPSEGNVLSISSFTNRTSISDVDDITATITVHFKNAGGSPLSDEKITLTSPLGVLDPTTGAVTTNDEGNATITLSAGIIEGAGVLTAASDTGDADTQGFYTKGDAVPAMGGNVLTISSFTNSTLISKYNSSIITVHFDDENGTALSDKVITLTATLGVLDPVTGEVTTDTQGNATIELTAGTVEGAGVLTATSGTGDVVTQGFYTKGDAP